MNQNHLVQVIKRIDKHLSDIEREYAKKNIVHRIREDWGYAFYTGKLVAYVTLLKSDNYPFDTLRDGSLTKRIEQYIK